MKTIMRGYPGNPALTLDNPDFSIPPMDLYAEAKGNTI
jgi:hypothetical protein